ncbi:nucleotidyltransferase family protein [Allorhizobium sp. BGMRC 0089]|uniref:nucleotidyltransferase family protein n=1 Tax=Allorhizobium sonneratiae TaxID=2934936 RepID=UPI002034540C|nr:nucleotidyltransferase family protein [Allorhizobium sonneratiae]MCM2292207.1 nucleotidyltransferase family protein [Allorhizobium sonneratiae]
MYFSEGQFIETVRRNAMNRLILDALSALELPQATLTAGCLVQTIWNIKTGKDPDWAIKDYDLFYFDDTDLSWAAEDALIQKAKAQLGDRAEKIEIRNQARVHLWYREKFGFPCPPLKRVEDGIDRYLILCTRFGISLENGSVYAPDGYDDMWNGILRLNPHNPLRDLFVQKCKDYQSRWPWLVMVD